MFTIAARRMGYRVHTFSPDSDTPTGQVADVEVTASYDDADALRAFARQRRRGDLRVRERAERGHRGARVAGPGAAVAAWRCTSRSSGRARSSSSPTHGIPTVPFAVAATRGRAGRGARAHRHAGHRQDRGVRLRRQGPADGHRRRPTAERIWTALGRRRAGGREAHQPSGRAVGDRRARTGRRGGAVPARSRTATPTTSWM